MALTATHPSESTRVIYLVERQPPAPPPVKAEPPSNMEKIKMVVGKILFALSIVLLAAAVVVLAGHLIGFLALGAATAEMLFTTSIVGLIGGYYLSNPAKAGKPEGGEIALGPVSVYV